MLKLIFMIVFCMIFVKCQQQSLRGVQIRLTEKGMFYAVDVGIKIMEKDLKDNVINQKGKTGNLQYNIQNLRISKAVFANYKLTPVSGTGMRGEVSGISINAAGKLWFKYKKNWFIQYSDTIGISLKTKNIHFDMTLDVGSDSTGHPTIGLNSCSAGVNDIDLSFHGSASWIYNLFSGLIEDKLKDSFGKLLCSIAKKEINTRARQELETFPVVKKLDSYAEIDYRLTQSPSFTSEYMDAYLKGEFKSSKNPVESSLIIPSFTPSGDHSKMIYFWVTDYTLNTAGEVYHKAGRLTDTFAAWDQSVPSALRNMLNSGKFILLFPKFPGMFPNAPMSVEISSYQAPKAEISAGKVTLHIYANMVFRVKDAKSKIHDAFTLKFDITTTAQINVINDNISGDITSFTYDGKVVKSNVGDSTISLNFPFVKLLLEHAIISNVNPILKKGFPLPKVDEVTLEEFDIALQENVIRIGSNIKYVEYKK